jgi:hypothetical protein
VTEIAKHIIGFWALGSAIAGTAVLAFGYACVAVDKWRERFER